MIATRRGLLVLVVIAAILGVLVVLVQPRGRSNVDRSLVPRFDETRVKQLTYTCPSDGSETVVRDEKRWKHESGVADAATIDATLSALRAARWHRSGSVTLAGPTHCTLKVDDSTIAIGAALAGTEQTWVVRGTKAYLVDNWVAHALAPGRLALHVRRPLAEAKVDPHSHGIWIEPAVLQEIRNALEALEIVALVGTMTTTGQGKQYFGAEPVGTCSHDRILILTGSGVGCVEAAAWKAVTDADAKLTGPPEAIADRRPVPITPVKLVLPDRHAIQLSGKPTIDGVVDVDADRVRELLTALATPGELVPVPESAHTDAFLAVGADGTQVQLYIYGNGTLNRRGEPVAIKTPDTAIIARTSPAYRDPTRWREDPTTITSIVIDRVTYQRGAVLGEWTRKPAGKIDNALVDALAETIAAVQAPENAGKGKTTNGRKIKVTFTPPAGQPSSHTLQVTAPTRGGCRGRADDHEVMLPPELCTAVAAIPR